MSFSFGFVFTVNCKFVQILLIRISLGFLKRILHSSKWPWHLYHICRHLTSGGSPVWIAKSFLKNRSLFAFIIIRMLVWSQDLECLPSHHEKSMGMKRDWISWFHEERCSQDQLKRWFILVWMIKNFVCEKYYHFLYKIDNNRNKLQPLHWMKHRLTIFFYFISCLLDQCQSWKEYQRYLGCMQPISAQMILNTLCQSVLYPDSKSLSFISIS